MFLVSRGIDEESARRLGFTRFDTVQAACDAVWRDMAVKQESRC